MDSDEIQNMHLLEQNLQNLLLQKQAFQMELAEASEALKEIEKSGEEVFKIVGQLMLKTEKAKIKDELQNREKIINLRLKNIGNQENSLTEQLEKIRKHILEKKK